MNLTGIDRAERVVTELFLDSLIPAPRIPDEGCLLDVGSGAGVPGLPLKIFHPHLDVHLLEARARRVSFLRQVIRLLGLTGVGVFRGRIEEEPGALPFEHYPLITARALAPLSRTLAWCSPLLSPEGSLVCFLGPSACKVLDESREVMDRAGVVVHDVIPYTLPGSKGKRHTVFFQRKQ
ncbi:MAG: 16S rRNA (guanine(527)-N(7))-methyltransferase RsmG [Deltaproteobacteria bacterium]|nr:16S rRNA (guanine(527)-N(7))-methyltransferase RsmG [Deltaproteobacteria bacterium]